jgi:hypothetical protein
VGLRATAPDYPAAIRIGAVSSDAITPPDAQRYGIALTILVLHLALAVWRALKS